ncbi:high frequency lysogenization protein HflD [Elongatibacter sediminis]|uniref:High frequency lysogenization protein HflD homolog n=1 Tax=Elongatibacter sediminis TaxID=3119006 RepID=A0AAW9RDZ8_9GAMM
MKERTLALAGVIQATELVRQAAWHGTWSGYAASASLDSLFRLEADCVDTVYGGVRNLRLGLETLVAMLRGENRNSDALRYAVGLLQVERRFVRNSNMQQKVGERLEAIGAEGPDLEPHEREDHQAHQVAGLYAETISSLTPRIVVNGRPQFLKRDRTVDWVRTLLLCGLRSAVLWDQLGGGRFELLFRRRRILREASELLYN